MPRFTMEVTDDQAEWLAARGQEHGWSQRETVRRLIEEVRSAGSGQAAAAKKDRRSKRARAVEAVRRHFNLEPAAEELGVSRAQLLAWCDEDPAFAELVEDAQAAFVAGVEAELIEIGRGLKKGNVKALTAFLEAHHPTKYGRLKLEILLRVLDPIIEGLLKELRVEFADLPDRLERVRDKFESLKLKRLVAFT